MSSHVCDVDGKRLMLYSDLFVWESAASWAATTQSVGYVIGATGPILLGWIHDATQSFFIAIVGMIVINVLMIAVQFMAVPRKSKDTVDITVKGVESTFSK